MKSDALAQAAKAMEEAQKEKDVSALIKVRPCFACRPVCGRTHRSLAPRRSSTRSTGRPGTVLLVATLGHMSHTKASISYFSMWARAQFACTKQDKTQHLSFPARVLQGKRPSCLQTGRCQLMMPPAAPALLLLLLPSDQPRLLAALLTAAADTPKQPNCSPR